MVLGLREQDVNVVAHGIDFDQRRIELLEDASDVGVDLAAFFIAKELAAVLRAEHKVNDDVGEGLRHIRDVGFCRRMSRPYRADKIRSDRLPGPSARAIT